MGQTSYSINIPAVSYPGQIADDGLKDILSAINVAAAMIFGILGVRDSANVLGFDGLAVKAPALTTDISVMGSAMGLVIAQQAIAQDPSVTNPTYPIGTAIPVMRKGRGWVSAETAMADGDSPFVRFTANGALYPGNFRNDADTAKAVQMPSGQAIVRGTTSGAGYAVVEFDIV